MKEQNIHPTAIVAASAHLGKDVKIGPYSIVGANVTLEDHVELMSHVVVDGHTTIGAHTTVFPFASLGLAPQDLKYKGEASKLTIGKHCVIREYVTMNPGTEGGDMITSVGDYCLFMVSAHVAHDCRVGSHIIMANHATLGGHVEVGDYAILGGLAAIHQRVRIGAHAIIGGMSGIERDVIPYGMAMGERASLVGLNLVGLKRRGFSRPAIDALRAAYSELFESTENTSLEEGIKKLQSRTDRAPALEIQELIDFITADTSRTFCRPKIKT
jgi:UDP-N-acetylglucosamine acyltransferase